MPGLKTETNIVLMSGRGGFLQWQGTLPAGTYALLPFSFTFWHHQRKARDYTIVVHSNNPLELSIGLVPVTVLADCLIATLLKEHDYCKPVSRYVLIYCRLIEVSLCF